MIYPDWFTWQSKNFINHLNKYRGAPNINFLQIGAYTGDASVWMLENVLTNKSSLLVDVDTWRGSEESIHKTFDWVKLESFYDERMSKFSNVKKYKGTSFSYLTSCSLEFDFIYIDGDHTSDGVYDDAILSFPLLKDGGIMAFDDYLWKHDSKNTELEPKMGIDKFLKDNEKDIQILINEYQVWIKKSLK